MREFWEPLDKIEKSFVRVDAGPLVDSIVLDFTTFGSSFLLISIFGFLYYSGMHKKVGKDGLHAVLLSGGVVALLKFIFARPLPPGGIEQSVIPYGFPSGHTATAFAAAYVLSRARPQYRAAFYTIASFVGLSRVYIGVHYPTDILAGAIVGLGIGYLVFRRSENMWEIDPDK